MFGQPTMVVSLIASARASTNRNISCFDEKRELRLPFFLALRGRSYTLRIPFLSFRRGGILPPVRSNPSPLVALRQAQHARKGHGSLLPPLGEGWDGGVGATVLGRPFCVSYFSCAAIGAIPPLLYKPPARLRRATPFKRGLPNSPERAAKCRPYGSGIRHRRLTKCREFCTFFP
jgi:hypothetical protein